MNYKKATIATITIGFILYFLLASKLVDGNRVDNYLYMGQHDLSRHLIAIDETAKGKIIFMGSSAVAGNSIPPFSTLIDHFNQQNPKYQAYNLAALQANLLDANVMLNILKNKSPRIAILGIDPTVLLQNQSSIFSKYNSDHVPPELKVLMRKYLQLSLQDKIEIFLHSEPSHPTDFQIWWKSSLINIREKFWGPLFNKKLYGVERTILNEINSNANSSWYLIDSFIKLAKENKIIPVVFIGPILNSTYPKQEYFIFQTRLKEKAEMLGFYLFDYSSYLTSSHEYFTDFVHLTPLGYKEVARKLTEDLIQNRIITGLTL